MSRPSSQTGSSSFSDPTKLEVLRLAGPNCWACNTRDPQFAHVIAQTDTQVGGAAVLSWILKLTHYHVQKEVWEKCELINFSYSSPANSVPLCPSCHAQFDNSADPGFVFSLPTSISSSIMSFMTASGASRVGSVKHQVQVITKIIKSESARCPHSHLEGCIAGSF